MEHNLMHKFFMSDFICHQQLEALAHEIETIRQYAQENPRREILELYTKTQGIYYALREELAQDKSNLCTMIEENFRACEPCIDNINSISQQMVDLAQQEPSTLEQNINFIPTLTECAQGLVHFKTTLENINLSINQQIACYVADRFKSVMRQYHLDKDQTNTILRVGLNHLENWLSGKPTELEKMCPYWFPVWLKLKIEWRTFATNAKKFIKLH